MDVDTGEVREISELTPEQLASGKWKELGQRPDPKCKKCYGRGYIGRDVVTNRVIECSCVKVR